MIHILSDESNSNIKSNSISSVDAQPNALDLRLAKVFKLFPEPLVLLENKKILRSVEEFIPEYNEVFNTNLWKLDPGTYEVQFDGIVEMGLDEAGWVITRSTLNRGGVFFTSGLYDSGYKGAMAGCMHVTTGPVVIEHNARVAQFLLFKAKALKSYHGDYGFYANNLPKQLEVRYHGN